MVTRVCGLLRLIIISRSPLPFSDPACQRCHPSQVVTMSLATLFEKHGIKETVLPKIAGPPWKIETLEQFVNYFDDRKEVKTLLFDAVSEWADKGDILSGLRAAWREAEADYERGMNKRKEGLPSENLDDPLREEVEKSLCDAWAQVYPIKIPGSWHGLPQLIGRLHRQLQKRDLPLMPVQGLQTLESSSALSVQPKRLRIGISATLQLDEPEVPMTQFQPDNIFKYLHGLKILLWSMAKAGAFWTDNDKRTLFLPLQPMLDHLAAAEQYALDWGARGYSHAEVLGSLIRVDEAIRKNWGKILRSSPDLSLGEVISGQVAFATSMWLTVPSKSAQTASPKNPPPPPPSTKGKGQKGAKGGGRQQGKGSNFSAVPPPPLAIADASFNGPGGPRVGARSVKTAMDLQTARGMRRLCKRFNDPRKCYDPRCPDLHKCDVLTADGTACGGDHPRTEHSGPFTPR